MKKLLGCLVCVMLLVFGVAVSANAVLILDFNDANYLGHIDDGIPASPALEAGYINDLTTLGPNVGPTSVGTSTETYDRLGSFLSGPFPTAVEAGADKDENRNQHFRRYRL